MTCENLDDKIEIIYNEIDDLKSLISENHYMNHEEYDALEQLITKSIQYGILCQKNQEIKIKLGNV